MQNPTVTFVVPCYKLAHLLTDCIHSILSQTYRDFEVLIMDDCSPDETGEVSRSFKDPRITHIRNEVNVGHLRNYNKGIGLARGNYVWLISADDYLRCPYILQRYVELLEKHPNVGYTFCSGVRVKNGTESKVVALYGDRDRIISGRTLLKELLRHNFILAASGLVRRECYERFGAFPLDMPWAGDWFLWCLFALYYDVGYFAEPMVCYRDHVLSMTSQLAQGQAEACCQEEIAIPWRIKSKADEASFWRESRACLRGVAEIYARNLACKRFGRSQPVMDLSQFEASLCENTADTRERRFVRVWVYAGMGNEYYWQSEIALAKRFYQKGLRMNPLRAELLAKRLLLALGGSGDTIRELIHRSSGLSSSCFACETASESASSRRGVRG